MTGADLRRCGKGMYVYGHRLRGCRAWTEALGDGWVGAGAGEMQMAEWTGFVPWAELCTRGTGHLAGLCSPSATSLSSGPGVFISLYHHGVSGSEVSVTSPEDKPTPAPNVVSVLP